MKQRNPFVVILLTIITFGIYWIVWSVKTKGEMNRLGAQIPTAWLIIVPFVNLWWLWKYSEGVDKVTGGKMSTVLSFVLLFLLGAIGSAILQLEFNKVGDTAVPAQPEALAAPAPGFGTPEASPSPEASPEPVATSAPEVPVSSPEATTVANTQVASTPEQEPSADSTTTTPQNPTQQV